MQKKYVNALWGIMSIIIFVLCSFVYNAVIRTPNSLTYSSIDGANIIDSLGAAASIISIGATVIGFIVSLLTVINVTQFAELKKQVDDFKNNVEKFKSNLSEKQDEEYKKFDKENGWFRILPYILLGNYNKMQGQHMFAIESYKTAVKLENKNIFANYSIGFYYAELYVNTNFTNLMFLKKAKKYLLNLNEIFESQENAEADFIKLDTYSTLGGVYGLYAQYYFKKDIKESCIANAKQSLVYFEKGEKINDSIVTLYVNMAISNIYIGNENRVYDNFKLALEKDKQNDFPRYKKCMPWSGDSPGEKPEYWELLSDNLKEKLEALTPLELIKPEKTEIEILKDKIQKLEKRLDELTWKRV